MTPSNQQQRQEAQYHFPYHWLPQLTPGGRISLGRNLFWGLEYLTYMHAVAELIKKSGAQKILDLGCGDGRLSDFLKAEKIQYVGMDRSDKAIALARVLNASASFHSGDGQGGDGFDAVCLIEVLEHIPDDEVQAFLKSAAGRLKPGGKLFISVPTLKLPANPKHYRHYSYVLLEQQLQSAGFKIQESAWVYRTGLPARLCQALLVNRLWTLNPSILTALIWKLHRSLSYRAKPEQGAHLLVVAC